LSNSLLPWEQPAPDDFYIACDSLGWESNFCLLSDVCMSELILVGKAKLVDISILNLGRFARGEFLQNEQSYGHIWKSSE
jgi:hypothetical protein